MSPVGLSLPKGNSSKRYSYMKQGILPIFEDPEIRFEHPHALQDRVQLVSHNNKV